MPKLDDVARKVGDGERLTPEEGALLLREGGHPMAAGFSVERELVLPRLSIPPENYTGLVGFLDHIRHRRFTLNLELKRIEHLADKIDLASRVMGIAMIIAALIVGSAIVKQIELHPENPVQAVRDFTSPLIAATKA